MNDHRLFPAGMFARTAAILLLGFGCWRVIEPFAVAILFSLAIAISTWRPFRWLLGRLGGRRSLAAGAACLIVALLVIAPTAMLVVSLGDAAKWILALIGEWRSSGAAKLPDWLAAVPVAGRLLDEWVRGLTTDGKALEEALSALAVPAQKLAVAGGRALGWGLGQVLFAGLLLFFIYRDGDRVRACLYRWAVEFGGKRALHLLTVAQSTVEGVMLGVLGAGLAQAVVALVGFAVAGIPNPYLLGALTFVSSLVPVGPPLIWGGAVVHLFHQGHPGWAVVMAFYGLFCISSVDNIVKPLLISRSSRLPFIVTFTGVVGGVLAFGVGGLFIGPIVLALALNIAAQDGGDPGER